MNLKNILLFFLFGGLFFGVYLKFFDSSQYVPQITFEQDLNNYGEKLPDYLGFPKKEDNIDKPLILIIAYSSGIIFILMFSIICNLLYFTSCPFCLEEIRKGCKKCKHCNERIKEEDVEKFIKEED